MAFVAVDQQERVTVWRRPHDHFGGEIVAGAGPIFDDKLLTEPLRQPWTYQARKMSFRPPAAKPTIIRTGWLG